MGHQTLLLLMNFLIRTCACVESYLKLIEAVHKCYSERMPRTLRFCLVSVILVSDLTLSTCSMGSKCALPV